MNEHISALHTDKYQLTMMYAHFKNGTHLHQRAFDLYFRKLPFGNGYTVFAGLERAVRYLMNLHFTEEDIEYIKSFDEPFDPAFYDYLRNFRFTGNIYALPEGTLTFPGVPMLRAEGSIIELQLIETALLNFIGFQSLVATKAARIRHVAPDEQLMEFGTRRAQEKDASVWGARAAYLAGFDATSNTLAGKNLAFPPAEPTPMHGSRISRANWKRFALMPKHFPTIVCFWWTLTTPCEAAFRMPSKWEKNSKNKEKP
jgi:nicotinate phosphoribosyltransferase